MDDSRQRPHPAGATAPAGQGSPSQDAYRAHADGDDGAASRATGATAEAMERLSHHLSMAGIRLAGLSRRLADSEDLLMLSEASDELDAAICEVWRMALATRRLAD